MTNLKDVIALKRQSKKEYFEDDLNFAQSRSRGLASYSFAEVDDYVSPDKRLSIGYSRNGDDFGLEYRVQRANGFAHRAASRFVAKAQDAGVRANLGIVSHIKAPSRNDIEEESDKTTFDAVNTLALGSSISHPKSPSGSLGGFIIINGDEGFISACHVIANSGRVDFEDNKDAPHIYSPGKSDVDILTRSHRCARLNNFAELIADSATEIDAAIATLSEGRGHLGNVVPDGLASPHDGKRINSVVGYEALHEDSAVANVGRTTKYTQGVVNVIGLDDVPVNVPGIGIVYFDNLLEIEDQDPSKAFSKPGDSGALVFTNIGRAGIGLVIAGGDLLDDSGETRKLTYACSLKKSLDGFNAKWL